jgi:hypothetical protein
MRPGQVAKPPFDLIPDNRAAYRFGYHKSGTRALRYRGIACRIGSFTAPRGHVHNDGAAGGASTGLDRRSELVSATKALGGGQHRWPTA